MGDDLRQLTDGGVRAVRDLVASLGLRAVDARRRPRVVADMVMTVDGRAAVAGRSVALGHPADRALLRELRTEADAILVGPGTLAAERYASLLDAEQRARRTAEGRMPHPVVVTVSRGLSLPVDEAPVFGERGVPVLAFGEEGAIAPRAAGSDVDYTLLPAPLTLTAVLDDLAARGVRGVLCEGGPTLLRALIAEDALDDLLVTVAPLLAAGDAPTILHGAGLDAPARLALREVHRADDHLFLHYGLAR